MIRNFVVQTRSCQVSDRTAARSLRTRALWAAAVSVMLLLVTGCTDRSADSAGTPTPEPTPTVFTQDLGAHTELAEPVSVTVEAEETGADVVPQNVGLSLESTDLADPRLDPSASTFAQRLAELGSPALRFGGNRLDRNLFWTSSGEPAPRGDSVVVGPGDLERLKKLTDATGASVTLGLPLGDFDPERAADMAAHAQRILGDDLVAVAVGNEPNGYTVDGDPNRRLRDDAWDPQAYTEELEEYAAAIDEAAPGLPIAGPDAYDATWMRAFADADVPNRAAISQHWYPLYDCESHATPGRGPRAQNLVEPLVRDSAEEMIGIGSDAAREYGLPLWLEETGPTSCPGTNDTSRTQAKSLWTVDFTLQAAQLGVERLAMHSMLGPCEGGAPMSVVCAQGEDSPEIVGRGNHAALRLAAMSTEGAFVHTESSSDGLRVYAVTQDDADRLVVTLVNSADAASIDATPLELQVPDGYSAVTAAQVSAETLTDVSERRFQPETPLPDKLPHSSARTAPTGEDEEISFDLDASSATVLVFERDGAERE